VSAVAVAPTDLDHAHGERGLDEAIDHAWERLSSGRAVLCPVCGGEMDPEYGAQALPISGRCQDCGARLT
jgi:RNA polymerase-binding transcription factor DksA